MLAVADQSQAIGDFLYASGFVLAEYRAIDNYREPQLVPVNTSIEQILADWFDIDLKKVEQERRAMLAAMRKDLKTV